MVKHVTVLLAVGTFVLFVPMGMAVYAEATGHGSETPPSWYWALCLGAVLVWLACLLRAVFLVTHYDLSVVRADETQGDTDDRGHMPTR